MIEGFDQIASSSGKLRHQILMCWHVISRSVDHLAAQVIAVVEICLSLGCWLKRMLVNFSGGG